MNINELSLSFGKTPMFVKEKFRVENDFYAKESYVNINDIANLEKISDNNWEAMSVSGLKDLGRRAKIYHFDNEGAQQILNYMA